MLGHRYEHRGVAIAVTLTSCLFLIPYAAVQLAGVGYLLSGMSGGAVSFTTGVVVATILAILFSRIAGMRSVAWTDSLQALFMIVASTLVALLVVHELGGFGALFERLAREHPQSLVVPGNGVFSLVNFLGLTLPWFFFSLSNPQVSQRLFMPRDLSAMRRMLLGFLVFGFIYTLVSVLWGFSALVAFPDLASPDLATPTLLASRHVPPVLGVIVMVGILAAAVSTIDSIMLTLASMIARDLRKTSKGEASEQAQLRLGKWVMPVIALIALGFAELRLDLIAVLSVASSSGLVVAVPAIVGAFFWARGTAAGALVSIVGAGALVLASFVTGIKPLGLPPGLWGLPVAALLYIAISLVTRPPRHGAQFMQIAARQ